MIIISNMIGFKVKYAVTYYIFIIVIFVWFDVNILKFFLGIYIIDFNKLDFIWLQKQKLLIDMNKQN